MWAGSLLEKSKRSQKEKRKCRKDYFWIQWRTSIWGSSLSRPTWSCHTRCFAHFVPIGLCTQCCQIAKHVCANNMKILALLLKSFIRCTSLTCSIWRAWQKPSRVTSQASSVCMENVTSAAIRAIHSQAITKLLIVSPTFSRQLLTKRTKITLEQPQRSL